MSTYHGVNACLAWCLDSSSSSSFQQGEGPSRGLLCDYEPSCGPSFQALLWTWTLLMCNCSAFRSRIEEMWLLSSTLQPRPRTRVPIHTHWILFNISSKTLYLQVEPKNDFMASRFHKADIETRCKWLAENKIPFSVISFHAFIESPPASLLLHSTATQPRMQCN